MSYHLNTSVVYLCYKIHEMIYFDIDKRHDPGMRHKAVNW